jgi:hypothetical protein
MQDADGRPVLKLRVSAAAADGAANAAVIVHPDPARIVARARAPPVRSV